MQLRARDIADIGHSVAAIGAREAGAREVVVATDDARIADALAPLGVTVCMTSSDHASGTDRLAECADIAGWGDGQVVVNLQGDEP
ncbi:MAG: hypothetical protein KIT16_20885, partial [Rhodospirillaceae bacterium]|nr:hypothetical protein [Rhodospirillaceae bacterium]